MPARQIWKRRREEPSPLLTGETVMKRSACALYLVLLALLGSAGVAHANATGVTLTDADGYPRTFVSFTDVLGIPPSVTCPLATVWFDGGCRTQAWVETHVTGRPVRYVLGTRVMGGGAQILVGEALSNDVFRWTTLTDSAFWAPYFPTGPTRSGYPVQRVMLRSLSCDPATEIRTVRHDNYLPDTTGPSYHLVDWQSNEYEVGQRAVFRDSTGYSFSASVYPPPPYFGEWMHEDAFLDCRQRFQGQQIIDDYASASGTTIGGALAGLILPAGTSGFDPFATPIGPTDRLQANSLCYLSDLMSVMELGNGNCTLHTEDPDTDPGEWLGEEG